MVRPAVVKDKEDDLFHLAAKAGSPESQAGLSVGSVLLEPGTEERRGIDQAGDPGFKTRVKTPDKDEPKKSPGRQPRGSAVEKTVADIQETLEEKFALIFGLMTSALPVTGTYGVENTPKAVHALLDIGKRRPAVLRALMKIADGADGMEIGKFIAGLAISVQVDMQRMRGDEIIARTMGVTEILEKYFVDESGPVDNPNVTEQVTHAPRFQPVS